MPKRKNISVERYSKPILTKAWGASKITKDQAKRALAARVEKKFDELD